MTSDNLDDLIREKIREGRGRRELLQLLKARGLSDDAALATWRRARTRLHREGLPAELRRAGRRHLIISIIAFAAGLAVAALLTIVYLTAPEEERLVTELNRDRVLLFGGIAALGILALGMGEWKYARSRTAKAREEEEAQDR